ncbi:phasin family protein [Pseudovibrio sp. Tun.PSC04-5.I4]|uniref:phasin family protein n=1 Tax=Pseudovibrio sp. Tun.PSC04-5.I4 TaxID=1798213 RepID=UPI0008825C50|nr:phasin family protein [Pseudovibrio sp. Tun.PSC04-5.I4]SDR29414.1 Phasin protein [Pseudovibrio sp. Tun.PSC04-5.I4]
MFNIDKEMKEAMDRLTAKADDLPWQGWFWAQGGDQLSNTALEHAVFNNKTMLESCQAMMNANMAFMNRRTKANTDFLQELRDCPTGVEFSRLASDYVQQAFEDCRQEGTRNMNEMTSSMKGTVSKTQKATSEALTSIDDLKAMAQAAPTKAPAKPRRRAPRKATSTRSREKSADKPSSARPADKKGVSA